PFLALDQGDSIQAEYVWIDGSASFKEQGRTISTQTITHKITELSQLPNWDFDGSSTNKAPGHGPDVYLRPAAIFKDPFCGGHNIVVLASTYNSDGSPNKTNHRHYAAQTKELAKQVVAWFGLEKEDYTLLDIDDRPYG
ncbi:hypothetical protein BGW80DRAFT_1122631, partial [Lactifluus volemus]